jgi:hypothetical protein
LDLLLVACAAEEEFERCTMPQSGEEYVFCEERVGEYKTILWEEYESVCSNLQQLETEVNSSSNVSGRSRFYALKKSAIERLLSYYDWWPENVAGKECDELPDDAQDEFGFIPTQFDQDVVPALRYHHAKNLLRSYFARHQNAPQDAPDNDTSQHTRSQQFSIIPLKSTIPTAGRGVVIDGHALAGTLLAFFPGKIWPKEHLMSASLQTQVNLS